MKIHGKEYTEVKDRIPLLLEMYPEASIETTVLWNKDDFSAVCIRAVVRMQDGRLFTGLAYEERVEGDREVNATSWVENAETSAIGRALANMNIGVAGARPSAEEMQKVERMAKAAPPENRHAGLPWDDLPPKPSMQYVLMEDRVKKAGDLADLKRIWTEVTPALKDVTPEEKKKLTQLKDERKTFLMEASND